MHHLELGLHIDRSQISGVAQGRLVHVLELGGLRSYEKLLFGVIRDSRYTLGSSIRLHRTHVSIFVFLSVLDCVPVLVLAVWTATLGSRSDR